MVKKFGLHAGVGEVCAASGPAERKTVIASVTVKIATVLVRMKSFILRPVRISDTARLGQAPRQSGERRPQLARRAPLVGDSPGGDQLARVTEVVHQTLQGQHHRRRLQKPRVCTIQKLQRWKLTGHRTIKMTLWDSFG